MAVGSRCTGELLKDVSWSNSDRIGATSSGERPSSYCSCVSSCESAAPHSKFNAQSLINAVSLLHEYGSQQTDSSDESEWSSVEGSMEREYFNVEVLDKKVIYARHNLRSSSAVGETISSVGIMLSPHDLSFRFDESDDEVHEDYQRWFEDLNKPKRRCTSHAEAWFNGYLLSSFDHGRWMNTFQMGRSTFLWLCNCLEVANLRKESSVSPSIPISAQFGATLYYLMTGADYREIAEKFGISHTIVATVLEKCVSAVVGVLGQVLRWPDYNEMLGVSRKFLSEWSIPNCQGVLGTTHVHVLGEGESAASSEATRHSIALQAVCDFSGLFLNVYCAYPGTLSNNEVLRTSGLYRKALSGEILRVSSSGLRTEDSVRPYLVADNSYEFLPWLLVPGHWSNGRNLSSHLDKSSIQDAFRELLRVFKSLRSGIRSKPPTAPSFVHACCILHNVLLIRKRLFAASI